MDLASKIVGSWRVTVEIPEFNMKGLNLATFADGGNVVVAFPSPSPAPPGASHKLEYFSPALGSWKKLDRSSVAMVFESLGTDETGAPIGTHRINANAQVATDGSTWSGGFSMVIESIEGLTTKTISGTVSAVRIDA